MKKTAKTSRTPLPTHPLQSPAWAEFRQAMGVDVARLDGWMVTFHPIPHTPFTVGYFPKGPKPDARMVDALRELGKSKNAVFIQLEPDVEKQPDVHVADLVPSHHPLFTRYTFILDLTKPEEELLKAMHPKTRYNLRIAAKHNVVVREDNSDEAFASYLRLNEETTGRQGFYAHNRRYHETMWRIMKDAGVAHLFTATYNGNVLAAWIIFAWGKTLYYPYGTSSRENREVMAPTRMLWEVARWGIQHGYEAFDLWGAMGPDPDPADPWFGFHRFKQGFAPSLVEHMGSYDLVIRPTLYRLYTLADRARWFVLSLKKKLGR